MRAHVEVHSSTEVCIAVAKAAIDVLQPATVRRATVDRYDGLTLLGDSETPLIRATGLLCGYHGTGSLGTIEVLTYAGFDVSAESITAQQSITLDK